MQSFDATPFGVNALSRAERKGGIQHYQVDISSNCRCHQIPGNFPMVPITPTQRRASHDRGTRGKHGTNRSLARKTL